MRQIVLDTETTGLSADNGDRIIEIGCVELLNRKLTGQHFHTYLNPERDSHEEALRVHGIGNDFLKDKPKFVEVVDRFLEFIAGSELIIHNASFDLGFLNKELELANHASLNAHIDKVIDTLSMAKDMFPGKRNSLDALCDRFDIDNSSRTFHGALLDAELLADVYICMTRGQDALMIEDSVVDASGTQAGVIDMSQYELPVLLANKDELTKHEEILQQLVKSSKGKNIWKPVASDL